MEQIGIELEQALDIILKNCNEIEDNEEVLIIDSSRRILAEDVYSPINNPPFDKSPLDGFALRAIDTKGASVLEPKKFLILDTVYAGSYSNVQLKEGEAVRIMTGAPIPDGADCVIRLEDVEEESETNASFIFVKQEMKYHSNYCFKGEDTKQGDLIIKAGQKISYIEQGLLASLGVEKVKVKRRCRIGLFVTGDELLPPGAELRKGKIYDSNLMLLYTRLLELGTLPVIAKYLPDSADIVTQELAKVISEVDLIITTGGVSVGDKDIFHEVLPMLGAKRLFWKVKLKPGTPAMFAIYRDKPMFHLSGNPFAAVTTFELLVRPCLARISSDQTIATRRKKAILKNEFGKESKNRRFIRASLKNGEVTIPASDRHSSGMIASMQNCNCLIDISAGSGILSLNSEVNLVLLETEIYD